MATEKLYNTDPYLREFAARVEEIRPLADSRWGIILDRTAFYPEGGGQPCDSGWLDDIPVAAVFTDAGAVVHVTAARPAGDKVYGRLDWNRRFDHMQQHSGEHVLSAAFADLFGAENIGFHLGADGVYIDVTLDTLTAGQAAAAEARANDAVFANLPITSHITANESLATFPLRKQPAKSFDNIRLVSVAGVDCCPCGGTHVAATGEIGLVKIRAWERKAGAVRVDFVCGGRALADYRLINDVAREAATHLSAPVADVAAALVRHQAKLDTVNKELQAVRQELNGYMARQLFAEAMEFNGLKIVTKVVAGVELADLARQVLAHGPAVVLLAAGSAELDKSHFLFACPAGTPADMGAALKRALALTGGRGGGNAHWAQGGGSYSDKLEDALRLARKSVSGED